MATAFHGYRIATGMTRSTPLAKAGIAAGLGKAFLLGVPAVLVGLGIGYALSKAFDVRWNEFGQRAADGDSTMMPPGRQA